MKTYLLLLRGINVGGKNRLPMGELKELLEKAGCLDVKTYINSGNVFFRSDEEELQFFCLCQKLILDHFHMAVSCQVISLHALLSMNKQIPNGLIRTQVLNTMLSLPLILGYLKM